MVAPILTKKHYTDEQVNEKFLELLPGITSYARRTFRDYTPDRRDNAVSDVIAWTFIFIKQLANAGKLDEAYPTQLAKFAVGRHREGRLAGVPQSSPDVMAEHCRVLGRSCVHNAGLADHIADTFQSEATATDARYPVHKTVAFRIDFFQNWLKQQSQRDQQIIRGALPLRGGF